MISIAYFQVKKIQIPDNPLKKRLTKSKLKQLEDEKYSDSESDDNVSVATTTFNIRVKGETPEEKRDRKQLFKEAKRVSCFHQFKGIQSVIIFFPCELYNWNCFRIKKQIMNSGLPFAKQHFFNMSQLWQLFQPKTYLKATILEGNQKKKRDSFSDSSC